jgi:hypothetical protein
VTTQTSTLSVAALLTVTLLGLLAAPFLVRAVQGVAVRGQSLANLPQAAIASSNAEPASSWSLVQIGASAARLSVVDNEARVEFESYLVGPSWQTILSSELPDNPSTTAKDVDLVMTSPQAKNVTIRVEDAAGRVIARHQSTVNISTRQRLSLPTDAIGPLRLILGLGASNESFTARLESP